MERLDLYGDIDACVCCLDSVNYVTRPAALARAFLRVHTFLAPGGVFLFDARTPQFYRETDGQMFADETDDTLCLWRSTYSKRSRRCLLEVDLFQKEGTLWRRDREEHTQYAYTPAELEAFLRQAGFVSVRQYANRKLRPPNPQDDRIFFAAVKGAQF